MSKETSNTNDPMAQNRSVSGSRHRWRVQDEDGSYTCIKCGIKMMNVWMSGMRNGKAAIYFLHDGTRTSYRPDCR